ncbi:hypothetical protein [Flaviaesturariibacter amylovorans]|uniref:hypothetical protein n=1 Tax=Flaviaesturariibacter amylovorans TaxID=1084520 RepID=UPI0031E55FA3
MQARQFQALNAHQQLRGLLLNGACIGERIQQNKHILLFQLRATFVEVYFTSKGDRILSSRKFRSPVGLKPYL